MAPERLDQHHDDWPVDRVTLAAPVAADWTSPTSIAPIQFGSRCARPQAAPAPAPSQPYGTTRREGTGGAADVFSQLPVIPAGRVPALPVFDLNGNVLGAATNAGHFVSLGGAVLGLLGTNSAGNLTITDANGAVLGDLRINPANHAVTLVPGGSAATGARAGATPATAPARRADILTRDPTADYTPGG